VTRDYAAWVIDTETTGQTDPQVIEFARAEVIASPGPRFELGSASVDRYKPTKAIELGAIATHHILPDELDDCPPPPTEFGLPRFVIGHNVDYDWEVMGSPSDVYRIDTLALARGAWPDLDSYKLGALTFHLFPAERARDCSVKPIAPRSISPSASKCSPERLPRCQHPLNHGVMPGAPPKRRVSPRSCP
jgi:exodeoxyribonuclease X